MLTEVFRYLDPNDSGNVSVKEFSALNGIWRELRQTMWEFVQHLRTRFGTLADAWDEADADGNGSLDNGEFLDLAVRWAFDGPVLPIYMFLDKDGGGSISKTEWMMLETIEEPSW